MIYIKGKYNTAKVYTDNIEEEAYKQILNMMNQKFCEGSMKGVFTTCISQSTIDESAMAYKPADEIIGNIGPTAEIINIVKPVYNFKASE